MSTQDSALHQYGDQLGNYRALSSLVGETIKRELDRKRLLATVSWRAKSTESLQGKLRRSKFAIRLEGGQRLGQAIGDLAAVRVCVYQDRDIEAAIQVIQEVLQVIDGSKDDKRGPVEDPNEHDLRCWYRAIHMQVQLSPQMAAEHGQHLAPLQCEVQVCTLFAHVWNEVEHDAHYKPDVTPSNKLTSLLEELGRLTRQGDVLVTAVLQEVASHRENTRGRRIDRLGDLLEATEAYPPIQIEGVNWAEDPDDMMEAVFRSLQEAGVSTFGEFWESIDVDRFHSAEDWIEILNRPRRDVARRLGRGILRIPQTELVWLRDEQASHRLAVSLLPKLASEFAMQDNSLAVIARTAITDLQGG